MVTTNHRAPQRRTLWSLLLVFLAALWGASSGCAGEVCADDLSSSCQPLYPPTFEAVYSNTIQASCALGGSACHGSPPGQGGLYFGDIDAAHAALQPYVAGDALCSMLVGRTSSEDPDLQMPPGQRLSEAERCSIYRWVAAGAPR